MNRSEAEKIVEGYISQCESGARDWGWVDAADEPCRSFLFFHPDYYNEKIDGMPALGMVDIVREGGSLESYVNFMINAIERPSDAEKTLEELKESFLTEGSPVSLLKAFSILMEDRYACHILDDGREYMRLLLAAALESGDQDASEMISDRGWKVFCKLESGNWGLDPINKEVERMTEAGDHAGAEALYRDAMEACEIVLGPEDVSTLDCAKNLGDLLIDIGNMDGAEEVIRKELAGRESSQGPDHEDTLHSISNLAYVLAGKGEIDEAVELFQKELAAREKLHGPDEESTLMCVCNLGLLLHQLGKDDEASGMFSRALDGFYETVGLDDPRTLQVINNFSSFLKRTDRISDAVSLLKKYSDQSEAAEDALTYNLACYECILGNHDEAKGLLDRVIDRSPDVKDQALADEDLAPIHDWIIRN